MNYKVLYRKYRPDNFDNIIGQDHIIQTLKNSIIHDNISHAYIFSGPRGTGKTSTAKVFAKVINCPNQHDGVPCNNCDFCNNFYDNPDILEIDAASNNGVNEIRTLIDNIKLTPTNSKYKIYIIDEVHMMTTSAFNALLLTLEEPPKHVIFILATTNIENVPITILSRCQRFDFQKIDVSDIADRLKYICNFEKIGITDEAVTEIAYLSEGSMRDALSLLDQLSKSGEKITLKTVESKIKIVSQKSIDGIFKAIEKNDLENLLEIISNFKKTGVNYKFLLKKLIFSASDRIKQIKLNKLSSRITYDEYKNLIMELTNSLNKININVDSYTILEVILIGLIDTEGVADEPASLKKETKAAEVKSKSSEENNYLKELVETRVNNCFAGVQKKYLEEFKKILFTVCNNVNISQKIKNILIDCPLVAASESYLILSCDTEFGARKNNGNLQKLEEELKKEIKKEIKLVFLSDEEWQKKKNEYIINNKNGVKYEFKEEEKLKQKGEEKQEKLLDDIFDKEKIEII